MILITGMPRAGTSFIQKVFETHGQYFVPKLYTEVAFNPGFAMNLSEPSSMARLCHVGAPRQTFSDAMHALEKHWASQDELVMKLPQLCFFPGVCGEYTRIISCVRPVDHAYLKSAKGQGMEGWLSQVPDVYFLMPLGDRTLKGLAAFWRKKAFDLKNFYNSRVSILHFGNKLSYYQVMQNFTMDRAVLDEAWAEHWRGSRF